MFLKILPRRKFLQISYSTGKKNEFKSEKKSKKHKFSQRSEYHAENNILLRNDRFLYLNVISKFFDT